MSPSPPGNLLACPGVAEDGRCEESRGRLLKSRPGDGAISRLTESHFSLRNGKSKMFQGRGLSYLGGLVGSPSSPGNLLACPGVAKDGRCEHPDLCQGMKSHFSAGRCEVASLHG